MNRIISLFLFIFIASCLNGQYNSPIKNKVTLGVQTSADGLVWRGIRADTTTKIVPLSDTSAYIILDTVEKTLWLYKAGQVPKWQQVGGSTLDTATMLLPYWRSGRFSGVLPVANGGTNTSTAFTAGSVVFAGASGTYTQDNSGLFYDDTNDRLGIGTADPRAKLQISGGVLNTSSLTDLGLSSALTNGRSGVFQTGSLASINTRGDATSVELIAGVSADFYSGISATAKNASLFAGTLRLITAGLERMRISSTGNVGIGTESPTARLHVKGVDVTDSNFALKVEDSNNLNLLSVKNNGDVTLKNPLSVVNGGTGNNTLDAADIVTKSGTQTIGGAKTFTDAVTGARFNPTGSTATGTGLFLPSENTLGFMTNSINRLEISSVGNFSLYTNGTSFQWVNTGNNVAINATDGALRFFTGAGNYNLNLQIASTGEATFNSSVAAGGKFEASFSNTNTSFDNNSYLRLVNTGLSTLNQRVDLIMRFADGPHNGTGGISMVRESATGRSGKLILQPIAYNGNNTEALTLLGTGEVTINNLSGTGSRAVVADANGLLSAPTSSIMTKENVQVLNYGLNEILQINPVSFDYIDKNKWGDGRNLGFIVEDMYSIAPEVTGTMNNGDMYLDMVKLIPVLTKAIQEQTIIIKQLEDRIKKLEEK